MQREMLSADGRGVKIMKIGAKAAIACVALWAMAGPAAADQFMDVKARGKHHCRGERHHPPFSFKKPGETTVIGYDLDIVHAVAKRLGVTVETVSLSSAERIPMLNDRQDRPSPPPR